MRIKLTVQSHNKLEVWLSIMGFIKKKKYYIKSHDFIEQKGHLIITVMMEAKQMLTLQDIGQLKALNRDILTIKVEAQNELTVTDDGGGTLKRASWLHQITGLKYHTKEEPTQKFARLFIIIILLAIGIYLMLPSLQQVDYP